ncbi:hypothetical protein [Vitreimonas sp.]|uniref:hypothetical protein n=1 Tax=Vitreimonas sp. TaxID=3069702 RepID=UPI002D79571C|nr:hypothetical protein [Vitreimonas sp.]
MAQAAADVIARQQEIGSIPPATAQDDVDVRVVGVVVINRNPIERCTKIALHPRHGSAGEIPEALDADSTLGRQHQAEVALVLPRPFLQARVRIDLVAIAVIELALVAIRACAVALKILAVGDQASRRSSAVALVEDSGDDALPRIRCECCFSASKASAATAPLALRHELGELGAEPSAACLLRRRALVHLAVENVVVAKHIEFARRAQLVIAFVGPHQRRSSQ